MENGAGQKGWSDYLGTYLQQPLYLQLQKLHPSPLKYLNTDSHQGLYGVEEKKLIVADLLYCHNLITISIMLGMT